MIFEYKYGHATNYSNYFLTYLTISYRIIDVSCVKELCMRWYPRQYKEAPKKKLAHTALSDIEESIEELR